MSTHALVDDLTLRNRAYQALYALGETSLTVPTLRPGEALRWVVLAQEVLAGDRTTEQHNQLAKASQGLLNYIAWGRM